MHITIIGVGEIGRAIKSSLKDDLAVALWDKSPGKVSDQKPLAEIIPSSEIVFFCLPTVHLSEAIKEVKPFLSKNALVVSLSKGVEARSGKFCFEVFSEQVGENRFCLLSGPMLAEELATGRGAAAILASVNRKNYAAVNSIFKPRYINLFYRSDVRSVALSGVLKNIYSLAVGIADGLGYGNNLKGVLVGKILSEALAVGGGLSIERDVLCGVAGLADFIATAFSPYSLNREAGAKLATGLVPPPSEGLTALPTVLRLLKDLNNFFVLSALKDVVVEKRPAKELFDQLIYG